MIGKKNISLYIIIFIFIVELVFVAAMAFDEGDKAQYLKNLDYQVQMNKDGSMRVTETWDIDVSHTNTLFKTFNLSSKYGNITNVKVVDLKSGKAFEQIYEQMYHVTKDKFYALNTSKTQFEIAFGVSMDYTSGNRVFQISYDVENVVTGYTDCQEIYWQFLAKNQNAIPAKKVTGKITLPKSVANNENLLVWGHGPLNGKIEKASNSEVVFEADGLNPNERLEIRTITKEKMFNIDESKQFDYKYLNTALREEKEWSDEANENAEIARKILLIAGTIYSVIIIYYILQVIRYKKKLKQTVANVKINKLDYFRDIPRENTVTPAEASYLYRFDKERLSTRICAI